MEKPYFRWNAWAGQFLDNAYEVTIFCCFEKFLAYTLFLLSFIVVRHQMAELNGGGGDFCPPVHHREIPDPSKIELALSGPVFSVIHQARGGGGSEAQMPKVKVNLN